MYKARIADIVKTTNAEQFAYWMETLGDLNFWSNKTEYICVHKLGNVEIFLGTVQIDYAGFDVIFDVTYEFPHTKTIAMYHNYPFTDGMDDDNNVDTMITHIEPTGKIYTEPFVGTLEERFRCVAAMIDSEVHRLQLLAGTHRLLIHCAMGKSRSVTALMFYSSIYLHKPPIEMLQYLTDATWYIEPSPIYCRLIAHLQFP